MRKAFYYNFLPTKAEEEAAAARNAPHVVSPILIEIRDWQSCPPPRTEAAAVSPWVIRRVVTRNDVAAGEIMLSQEEMLDHVFKYWKLESANHVVQGNKRFVVLTDYTDDNMPKSYENAYVKCGGSSNEGYIVGLMDVLRSRVVSAGDEIGLFWDVRPACFGFCFKLLRRGNNH